MTKVDGVDYSPEGIEALRQDLIKLRNSLFGRWPEAIGATVMLTHTIALLSYLKEMVEE